ncbi:serine hydrolase [Spirosoma validum]|uniref:Serine hydrolase n=1 Tax=Spirosoma validum TaxID=2771355 RepID=A0A927B4T8_9BACT|nr:serine hydrolase domain-containing protein [Spirosoma validum]MBD2755252.1 serine hydrolase [Spirosoma validum]
MKILLILVVLWPLSLSAQVHSPIITQAIDSVLEANQVPAIVAAIVKPTQILYGYGGRIRADRTDTIKATSKFHLGSNTKAVTSFMAAKLVEQGKLKWTDKLVAEVTQLG